MLKLLKGNVIFTKDKNAFEVHEGAYLVVKDKTVQGIFDILPQEYLTAPDVNIKDYEDAIIIPSFIDLHVHAPQFMQMGIGLNLELIEWLTQYTFMLEERFCSEEYAKKAYPLFVDALYENGTLRSVIYGTIHNRSNEVLIEALRKKGLSAYVGKVNMDQNAPSALLQETEVSLQETRDFIINHHWDDLIKPIITPRFVPSCSGELLSGLGALSKELHIPIQSHLSENLHEVDWVKSLYPQTDNYSSVYKEHGLYGEEKTLMAHGIFLDDKELEMAKNEKVYIVHCPNSNLNLSSGIMPLTQYLDRGIQVGLGSDVGAGHTMAMNLAISSAIQSSKVIHILDRNERILSESEAFYLATKENGSFFGKVGSFEEGYLFDALVIKDPHPLMKDLSPLEELQRFLYCGGPESIVARYLEGKEI